MLKEYERFKPESPYDNNYCAHIVFSSLEKGDKLPICIKAKKGEIPSRFGVFQKYSRSVEHVKEHENILCESPRITKHIKAYDLIYYSLVFDVDGKQKRFRSVVGFMNDNIKLWSDLISGFWQIDVDHNILWKEAVGDLKKVLLRANIQERGIAPFAAPWCVTGAELVTRD